MGSTELGLYSSKNKCAGTDTVFLPISEVCNGTVSLTTVLVEQSLASPGSANNIP